ncbi:tetratricopeptide repeat protein [Phaeospirillum tilakii]|uniref:protein O-GlcNAc transferase n=1 Tax=Phaeospirillum tilakii TaxID=741673 RepID=A0ABW5C8M3_9PROT
MTLGDDEGTIAACFAAARDDHQAGRLLDAARRARAILARDPRHAPSLHLLGLVADQAGHSRLALGLIERALALDWLAAPYHASLGMVLRRLGQPRRAAASYESALSLAPDWVELQVQAALLWRELGDTTRAAEGLRAALRLRPDWAELWFALGQAENERGRPAEAAEAFATAVGLRPDDNEAQLGLGLTLKRLGRVEEAAAAFATAAALRPEDPRARINLGATLTALGRLDAAAAAYREAARLDPGRVEPHSNLGIVLLNLGRHDEAAAAFQAALALRPDMAELHCNLGNLHKTMWQFEAAAARYRTALDLNPGLAAAWVNLGIVHALVGQPEQACACFESALATDPGPDDALAIQRSLLFTAASRDDLAPEAIAALHRRFGQRYGGRGPLAPRPAARTGEAGRRLRVGYLGSDFRRHPVATNLLPVLRAHDRARFEIHCYSLGSRRDEITTQFESLADGFHPVAGRPDEAIARQIAADGIDILVVLAGRFDQNRPSVAGWRAAPVQISLFDVATSGLAEMDYLVADRRLLPPGGTEYFTERPLRLPRFYLADLPPLPPPGPERQGAPVFCCFNNPAKIGPATLALWGRLLTARPDARLVLKYMGLYASAELRARFLAALTAAGATPDQIEMIAEHDDEAGFLARYHDADIALDPFPFSGSTTSFQALAMGVPVITWPWPRMISRWSAAMLAPLGLDELIAGSAEDYLARALAAADGVAGWRRRRGEIRAALATSALCDGPRWTRQLERLYRAVWRRALGAG